MYREAILMILSGRSKFIAILLGVGFSSLIMLQQPAIFLGLMDRTYSLITDAGNVDVWVMDPQVMFIDDAKPISEKEIYRIKGVIGVEHAYPMFKGVVRARTRNGQFLTITLIGVDDQSLVGAPQKILSGTKNSLRNSNTIIISDFISKDRLAVSLADGKKRTMQVGDCFELNDHRTIVGAIARLTPNFASKPVAYTTYSCAMKYSPTERNRLSYILVQVAKGHRPEDVARRISRHTQLLALTSEQFSKRTYKYYIENTGIPINFAATVVLGFIIGASIVAQTFYQFLQENLMNYNVLRALGIRDGDIAKMIAIQVIFCGFLGYILGVGSALALGEVIKHTQLAFRMPGSLMGIVFGLVFIICIPVAYFAVRRIRLSKPADVFRGGL